jgi:hypothetical protein
MAKYLLLYRGGKMPESEAEQAEVMKAWDSWFKSAGSAIADAGNPFTPGVKRLGSDGSITDAQADASGYTLVEADSLAAAADIAKGSPVLQGGASIDVYETFEVM